MHTCSLIGTAKVAIVNSRVLWGCRAPSRSHASKRIIAPLQKYELPRPFADPGAQPNRRAPSQTRSHKRIVATLRIPRRLTESSRPFANLVAQTNRRARSQTRSHKRIVVPLRRPMRSSTALPVGTGPPNLGAPQSPGRFIVGIAPWRAGMPEAPTCPTWLSEQPQVSCP